MSENRVFYVSVIQEKALPGYLPGHVGTVVAPSVKEAAGMYVLQTLDPIPMALGGTLDLRVQEEGRPDSDADRVTCWTDAEGLHVRIQTDSASEAIDTVMKPLAPSANEVSQTEIMTNSKKEPEVYVEPDLRIDDPIVPFEPPHPWTVFRVYYGNEEDPILVVGMSFEAALKKAEDAGLEVKTIGRVDFVNGIERMDMF